MKEKITNTVRHLVLLLLALAPPLSLQATAAGTGDVITLTVSSGNPSNFTNTNYTGVLSDGTVLGFYRIKSGTHAYWYLTGISTDKQSVHIPDSIKADGTVYAVEEIGYGRNTDLSTVDMSQAQNCTELYFPPTVSWFSNLPNIKTLHLSNYITVYNQGNAPYTVQQMDCVYVPKDIINSYYTDPYWYGYTVIIPEDEAPLAVTINMTKKTSLPKNCWKPVAMTGWRLRN